MNYPFFTHRYIDNHIKDDAIQKLQEEIALLKEKVQKLSSDNTTN